MLINYIWTNNSIDAQFPHLNQEAYVKYVLYIKLQAINI